MAAVYPFTALVGQPAMKLALILNAVNPRLGGVLIRGQKGTAKSTAARGLAALLPAIRVVDGCRFACDPAPGTPRCPECAEREVADGSPLPSHERPAAFVDLPLGATEDRVLGTLDLERAIQRGERYFEPGLLARANRGLLYVDEVNLLPDHLVDALLDAAAMGVNTVEREGLSFSHPAAFVLVGTMNPEEGDLRPQLLDRFALAVDVVGMPEPNERAEVVRRRIAFEADPLGFVDEWQAAEHAERERIAAARARLPRVRVDDHLLDLIARICTAFEVDGLRSDIVIYKTAATLAAYAGRDRPTPEDVRQAAELALPHRRRRQPFDAPGLDRERLDRLVEDHQAQAPDQDQLPDEPPVPDDSASEPQPDAVFEVGPPPSIAPPDPYPASDRPRLAASPNQSGTRRGGPRVESPSGRHVRSLSLEMAAALGPASRPLDLAATLRAAAPHQRRRGVCSNPPLPAQDLHVERHDIRLKLRQAPLRHCTLFVVDASGSMAARRRMAAAKGAVVSLLLHAYQGRDQVGLVAFRGTAADLVLPPTNSVDLAYARLRDLPTGGRTPLAAALRLAQATLARCAPAHRLLVLVSDGRANVGLTGGDPHTEAVALARELCADGVAALVVDTEDGPVRLGLAERMCQALGGAYLRLADLPPASPGSTGSLDPLAAAIRHLSRSRR